jgi:hypothetical protein
MLRRAQPRAEQVLARPRTLTPSAPACRLPPCRPAACRPPSQTSKFGERLKDQVEERLRFYDTGETPRKNLDVMKEVMAEISSDEEAAGGGEAAEGDKAADEPAKKKKDKKEKKRDKPEGEEPKKKKKKDK